MHQLPACAGNWWVIPPCPFLGVFLEFLLYFLPPASQGGQWQRGFGGHLVSSWGNPPPWGWYMTKKGKIALYETFSEEGGPSPISPAAGMHRKPNSWNCEPTWLFFHWREKGPFQVCFKKKNQIKNTPDKRHSQPTFIAWEYFYDQLMNCSKQVLQSNENTGGPQQEPWLKVWAHGVYSELTQLAAHGPALPLQMEQGCSTQIWVTY